MTTFLLLPGAGGASAYWSCVVPLLEKAGHTAVAVELPAADEKAGLDAYADVATKAIGSQGDIVLVAQSMGAFTAAVVTARVPVRAVVFVNAMIPLPGETPRAWFETTKSEEARKNAARANGYSVEFDLATYFLHDLPTDVARLVTEGAQPEAKIAFGQPAGFERWPDVPKTVVLGKDDRFFPCDFQVRVARERLGKDVEIVMLPGGHLVALSNPNELAEALLRHA